MTGAIKAADTYALRGDGIEIRYRRAAGMLDVKGEGGLMNHEGLKVTVTADPVTGLHLSATLLDSARDGSRFTLCMVVPDVSSEAPRDVTGIAFVTRSFHKRVGGPPPVLQRYDEPRLLTGTVS